MHARHAPSLLRVARRAAPAAATSPHPPPQTPRPAPRLGGLNGTFFEGGWGDLTCVNLREDLDVISAWPPQQALGLEWRLLERASWQGVRYRHYEGTFKCADLGVWRIFSLGSAARSLRGWRLHAPTRDKGSQPLPCQPDRAPLPPPNRTPCIERVYNALPPESRQGRVQLLVPDGHTAGVVHLAATGDHGWKRRLRLGWPLMRQVRQRAGSLKGSVSGGACKHSGACPVICCVCHQ